MKILFVLALWLPSATLANSDPSTPVAGQVCPSLHLAAAQQAGATDVVVISFRIAPDSSVKNAAIAQTSGDAGLDATVLRCVQALHLQPAFEDGVAVENGQTISVRWSTRTVAVVDSGEHPQPASDPSGPRHGCADFLPAAFRSAHVDAKTGMSFRVTTMGTVAEPAVSQPSGNGELDAAALDCVGTWRFLPAMRNGAPMEIPWQATVIWRTR